MLICLPLRRVQKTRFRVDSQLCILRVQVVEIVAHDLDSYKLASGLKSCSLHIEGLQLQKKLFVLDERLDDCWRWSAERRCDLKRGEKACELQNLIVNMSSSTSAQHSFYTNFVQLIVELVAVRLQKHSRFSLFFSYWTLFTHERDSYRQENELVNGDAQCILIILSKQNI